MRNDLKGKTLEEQMLRLFRTEVQVDLAYLATEIPKKDENNESVTWEELVSARDELDNKGYIMKSIDSRDNRKYEEPFVPYVLRLSW